MTGTGKAWRGLVPGKIRERLGMTPAGVTHVLVHQPGYLIDRPGYTGWWELMTVTDFRTIHQSSCRDLPALDGPSDVSEETLKVFVEQHLGYPVAFTAFRVPFNYPEIAEQSVEPAYGITPAEGDR